MCLLCLLAKLREYNADVRKTEKRVASVLGEKLRDGAFSRIAVQPLAGGFFEKSIEDRDEDRLEIAEKFQ
jgi:hypothetical protein